MNYFSVNTAHIMVATVQELAVDFSCLIAKNNAKINIGRVACRNLLFHLQEKLNLLNGYQPISLNEDQYPYYFTVNTQRYWVSFSHSQAQVAVMVMPDTGNHLPPRFGIDIEDKRISEAVTRRFFCEEELVWLDSLEQVQKRSARTLLWTLKESLIKAHTDEKLIKGLKNNLLNLLDTTRLSQLLNESKTEFNQVSIKNQVFSFSPKLKSAFVIIG